MYNNNNIKAFFPSKLGEATYETQRKQKETKTRREKERKY
jgi:hypothetical protein